MMIMRRSPRRIRSVVMELSTMRGDYRRVFTERLNSIGPLEILSVARMTVVVKSSANLLAKL